MKKLIFWSVLCAVPLIATVAYGQSDRIMPAGGGDKNLGGDDIRTRSVEMERIKRDAEAGAAGTANNTPALRFQQIKEDFEKIQFLQDQIITYYTKTKVIDYAKISSNAGEVTKGSTRLKANLFPVTPDEKKNAKKPKIAAAAADPTPNDVKTLIVDMDNTLAAFVGNPIFANPKGSSATDNAKARKDLVLLISLSAALKYSAERMPH